MGYFRRLGWRARLPAGTVCTALAAVWALGWGSRGAWGQASSAYKDTTLPFEKRAADMVAQMTFEEKAGQITTNIQAIPRLGIQQCRIGAEALHGLQGMTMYPDGMAQGAMFDPDLLHRVAGAIADDARSRSVAGGGGTGLFLWCPTVNMARDPRWGRNLETYGEDPYLSAKLGAAYCSGLQGDDPKYLKAIATPKHFVVYSMESDRQRSNAVVSERALREYYLPAFEGCFVEGKAFSTMSAYNAINGVPCSANDWLLTSVLRDDWKFQGAVVTDSGAVNQVFSSHHYAQSEAEAAAAAINAGVDIITNPQASANQAIVAAQNQGLFKEGAVDRAVMNSLLLRFRLGQFDPPEMVPYSRSTGATKTGEHSDLALQAAREAMVLLQNNPAPKGFGMERLLPLDLRRISSVAVVGTNANVNLLGSYSSQFMGNPNTGATEVGPVSTIIRTGTPVDAIKSAVGDRVTFRYTGNDIQESEAAAKASDVVIFIGGLDNRLEHTGSDRPNLDMPTDQRLLLERVAKANPLTVLVLTGGSPIALEALKEKVPAILMLWYDGEQGGRALGEVLFGKYNPAGRLPVTFYRSNLDLPTMSDYEVTSGRTYMYLKKPASFVFGHGLSYTSFTYKNLRIEPARVVGDPVMVSVEVSNTGALDGEEVAQIYVQAQNPKVALPRPIKQLVGFQRVAMARGDTRTLRFSLTARSFAYWDTDKHQFAVEPGEYEIMAGASSEDIRLRGGIEFK